MATVNFLYRSNKESSNLVLRLLYRDNNSDYVLGAKTKIEVSKNFWKNDHRSNSRDISIKNKQVEINSEINELDRYVIKNFNTTSIDKINKEWLNSIVSEYYNPFQEIKKELPTDLIGIASLYINKIEEIEGEVSNATLTKYNTIKSKMEEFQNYRKKIIYIKDINEDFKNELFNYYKTGKYGQNTASRELDTIKTFCYYAKTLGIETHPQLTKIKIKKKKVEKIYLTFEELEQIENLKNLPERLENARDWLIISCYLGQRVSDFLKFKKEMIRYEKDKNGIEKPLIEFIQQKTKKKMTIPVSPKVVAYLNKRNGGFPNELSHQRYNDYIKEVCEIAELKNIIYGSVQKNISKIQGETKMRGVYDKYPKYELITSHIGRRSFATNFYGEIPTNYLCYMTGHSTEKAFLEYIGKSNKDIAMELTHYF